MPTAAKFEQERQELATILASGIFNRAPGLAHLLTYICDKYFQGAGNQIKEYSIAVDALGRPAEFDQKRDSIVRVEAHRLRKRLKDYYEAAGFSHSLRIIVPSGQYAPRFELQSQISVAPSEEPALEELPAQLESAADRLVENIQVPRLDLTVWPVQRSSWAPRLAYGMVGVIFVGIVVVIATHFNVGQDHGPVAVYATAEEPTPLGDEVRILAGASKPYIDRLGRTWRADRNFQGGLRFSSPAQSISGTRDPGMYRSGRNGSFRYDIPLKPGNYELRLHFAETLFGDGNLAGGGETSRLFNVYANGHILLEMIDVIADAGPNAVDIRVFKDIQPGHDGLLHLECRPVVNSAFLNAIEISPGTPGRLRPIRIVTRETPWVDKNGHSWAADRFFQGGQLVMRSMPVAGTPDPELYRGERFGNITYVIPVAPSRYTVILHFAESWFGPDKRQRGGEGSRVFDLLCNGVALLRGFDIYREAGGADRALRKTFHGLEPNTQGKLVLSFVPRRNYSCINAIEVLDDQESRMPIAGGQTF